MRAGGLAVQGHDEGGQPTCHGHMIGKVDIGQGTARSSETWHAHAQTHTRTCTRTHTHTGPIYPIRRK
eukprot:6791269-Alexandrium_andersonii.AAC.1